MAKYVPEPLEGKEEICKGKYGRKHIIQQL